MPDAQCAQPWVALVPRQMHLQDLALAHRTVVNIHAPVCDGRAITRIVKRLRRIQRIVLGGEEIDIKLDDASIAQAAFLVVPVFQVVVTEDGASHLTPPCGIGLVVEAARKALDMVAVDKVHEVVLSESHNALVVVCPLACRLLKVSQKVSPEVCCLLHSLCLL